MAAALGGTSDGRIIPTPHRLTGLVDSSELLVSDLQRLPASEVRSTALAAEAERAERDWLPDVRGFSAERVENVQPVLATGSLRQPPADIAAAWIEGLDQAGARGASAGGNGTAASADIAGAIRADFILGYRDGKGSPLWEARFIAAFWGPTNLEECPNGESEGDPLAVSPAGHLGLGQFDPWTWHRVWELAGLPVQDWRSPFWQGYATAVWSNEVGPWPPAGWACFQ